MSKIDLTDATSLTNETSFVSSLNANNAIIETAINNTLSLDGTSPNSMGANLDMNNFQIINLPSPSSVNSPARLVDVVTNPTISVPSTGTSGSVVGLLNTANTHSGNNTFSGTNTFSGANTFSTLPTISAGATARSLLGNNQSFSSSVTALTNPAILGMTLVPTTGTNATALATVSTGAGTANQGAGLQQYYNYMSIAGDNVNCGTSVTTSYSIGHLVSQTFGGTNCFGGRIGISSLLTLTTATAATNTLRFYASVVGQGQANVADGGSGAKVYGGNFLGVLHSAATGYAQTSALYDQIFVESGCTTVLKTIHTLAYGATDAVQGSTTDAALLITAETGATAGGKNAILISNIGGAQPLATTASILSIGGSPTIATGIDLSGATISGNAFVSPGYLVNGSGSTIAAGNMRILNGTAIPAGGTAAIGYLLSSTTNFGIFFGSGVPTLAAAKGSLYLCSDGSSTSTRLYVNTNGSTTWTNVTTAA